MSMTRGIRGAVRVDGNTRENIFAATQRLLRAIIDANDVAVDDIASVFFTATGDLDADYPAYAARELGWVTVPLLCAHEMKVPGSMSGVIRVLMHVNTEKTQAEIEHQYLGETAQLRPDISERVRR
jgi:chorismate mutase